MLLTQKEEDVLKKLRNPVARMTQAEYLLDDLSKEEIWALYQKIDDVMMQEGDCRKSLGDVDETYLFELRRVKDELLRERTRREKTDDERSFVKAKAGVGMSFTSKRDFLNAHGKL